MDLNMEYAAHQEALMSANGARSDGDRQIYLARASAIAERIRNFQANLGAAAACAWSALQHASNAGTPARMPDRNDTRPCAGQGLPLDRADNTGKILDDHSQPRGNSK